MFYLSPKFWVINKTFKLKNNYIMKKALVILILTIIGLVSKGQTGPVFQYNHPSKQTIYGLATAETLEGYAYRAYLVEAINIGLRDTTLRVSMSNIDDVFNHLYLEEFYLLEGEYSNSGYNPTKGKMVPGVGHAWTGFGWVFRYGSFSIRLIKGDCGNILKTPTLRKIITPQIVVSPPPPIQKDVPNNFSLPQDNGGKITTPDPKPWTYEQPKKEKKKFFQRLGVKIGCVTIGIAGVGGILYAILHKGPESPHGTMSGGRPYTPPTPVTPGDGSGGRGN